MKLLSRATAFINSLLRDFSGPAHRWDGIDFSKPASKACPACGCTGRVVAEGAQS